MKPTFPVQHRGLTAWAVAAVVVLAPLLVAGRGSISHELLQDICQKPLLGLELEVCSREAKASTAKLSEPIASAFDGSADDDNDFWTYTTPCYRNGTDGPEICVYSHTAFAGGHGISILTTAERAAFFAQKPAFREPDTLRNVNRDIVTETEQGRPDHLPPLLYRVEAMPGKGYGVVATKYLNRGDLIMSVTASVVVDYALYDAAPERDVNRLQAAAVDYLPDLHRARFLNLSTHSATETYDERVTKILATNAFDIDGDDDGEYGLFVVFPEVSRLNHDCRPNADYHYDYDTLTQHVHAVRPIAAGEEITVSYMDLIKPRQQRVDKLQSTWGFQCGCSLCSQGPALIEASDARIAQINELRSEFQDYSTASRATPQMAELFVSLYQQERMDAVIYEAYSYAAIEWNGVGDAWMATKYARLAVDYGLASVGPRDVDVDEMQQLARDPWAHWSWQLRTSRRMQWGPKTPTKTKTRRQDRNKI
ncbi:SET domain protein [Niveomyces insectorum RCEF 264]|uniref:SET domain protein n=1 Tax=Niveomyces insectorum RCEF 264 TaxID=1081102 RepID=A0A167N253_9HYPO|nr:SET domain protein [Niveomyces insectorum RCEF 264]